MRTPEDSFLVAMKDKSGEFCLFVEAFSEQEDGKKYLKHTTRRDHAKPYSFTAALDAVELLREYKITAKAEPQ